MTTADLISQHRADVVFHPGHGGHYQGDVSSPHPQLQPGGRGLAVMEPSVAAVESSLVDLAGVSLETLRSIDSRFLAASLEELQHGIDHPLASVSDFGDKDGVEAFD
ncbi:hypothetical protein [Streptomyces sp. F001]|uniref:hypothetical protein n=1 Tax=Streptomyces sp. F001 TaxID=1510026 RepID=UPI00101E41C2|nr:hypothetical protein [Streptomyces sp. F001]